MIFTTGVPKCRLRVRVTLAQACTQVKDLCQCPPSVFWEKTRGWWWGERWLLTGCYPKVSEVKCLKTTQLNKVSWAPLLQSFSEQFSILSVTVARDWISDPKLTCPSFIVPSGTHSAKACLCEIFPNAAWRCQRKWVWFTEDGMPEESHAARQGPIQEARVTQGRVRVGQGLTGGQGLTVGQGHIQDRVSQ